MNPLPEGVKGKIRWAEHHLKLIDEQVAWYGEDDPHYIRAEIDLSIPGYLVHLRTRKPPLALALMVGDFFQNLRNSLDHLARGLVEATGGTPVDGAGGTQFPITDRTLNPPVIRGMNPTCAAYAEIERRVKDLQPTSAADRPLIWFIREFANIDKHQTLQFPTGAGTSSNMSADIIDPVNHVVFLGPCYTDQEIARLGVPNPPPRPEIRVNGTFTTFVYLPELWQASGQPLTELVPGLAAFLNVVREDIVSEFLEFFG